MTKNQRLATILLSVGAVLAVAAAFFVAWLQPWQPSRDVVSLPPQSVEQPVEATAEDQQSESVEPEPDPPVNFTIAAGGDMLIHMPVADSAWNGERWDFKGLMAPVQPYLAGANLSLCNMETPLAGPGETPSGYPTFGAPAELAGDMVAVGWDGCSTSTNHSLDRGFSGIVNTLDKFDEVGLGHVGTARTEVESGQPQVYEFQEGERTVTIAHIAAAYDTNGIPLPADAPWSWNHIDSEAMIGEAQQAREDGADMVIASAHCCQVEYTTDPEPYQVEVAEALAESGVVDIFISHHAHVPKTMEILPGGVDGQGMWAAYGLGNFISNQSTDCCREETSTGLLAFFDVEQEGDGPYRVADASWLGVTMDFTTGHTVRPLREGGVEGSGMSQEEISRRYAKLQAIMDGSPAKELLEPPSYPGEVAVVTRTQ